MIKSSATSSSLTGHLFCTTWSQDISIDNKYHSVIRELYHISYAADERSGVTVTSLLVGSKGETTYIYCTRTQPLYVLCAEKWTSSTSTARWSKPGSKIAQTSKKRRGQGYRTQRPSCDPYFYFKWASEQSRGIRTGPNSRLQWYQSIFGSLVIENGQRRYLSPSVWNNLSEEVREHLRLL